VTSRGKAKKKAPKAFRDVAKARAGLHIVGRRRETQLERPAGEPNPEALRSVTLEWLVPRLVDKFLRVHGIESRNGSAVIARSTCPSKSSKKVIRTS
jgi:hypothetical protein